MPDHGNPSAKPFFWIPLNGKSPQREEPVPHLQFTHLSGRMELEIEVRSNYLYVGSGQIELFPNQGREQARYTFARRGAQWIIPGTSIKGAIRSVVEAISNSCVKLIARGERIPRSHTECRDERALCPACRLFGTTGYRGRVHFADAVPIGEIRTETIKIADLWPPRRAQGRKFYHSKRFQKLDLQPARNHRFLETVPQGTKFRTVLYFENTSPAEMALLVRALGLERSPQDPSKVVYAVPIKLGGAKPRCLGSVRFTPRGIWLIQPGPTLLASLQTGGIQAPITETLLAWLEDESLLDRQAWEKFKKEASFNKHEVCPQGVY